MAEINISIRDDRTISSFEELARLVQPFRKDGSWIFRGVRQSDYERIPKIGRPGSRKALCGGDLPYDRNAEETMVRHFMRAAGPYVRHVPENRLEWLALAQHHGMFTRLLDWSESLLVAAYFAVEDARSRPLPPMIYAVKDVPFAPPEKHDDLDALDDCDDVLPPAHQPADTCSNRFIHHTHESRQCFQTRERCADHNRKRPVNSQAQFEQVRHTQGLLVSGH